MNQDVDLHSRPLGQAMHVDNNRSMENAVCRWLIIRPVEGATGKKEYELCLKLSCR
jgi:hypothetical protein